MLLLPSGSKMPQKILSLVQHTVRGKHNFYSGKLDVCLKIVKHYKKRETTENGADPTGPSGGGPAPHLVVRDTELCVCTGAAWHVTERRGQR